MSRRPDAIVLGLSGGVDSSVAALLLRQQGSPPQCVFMKNWEEDDSADYCSAAADLADATAVCTALGLRLRSVNFAAEYWDRVFAYFLGEHRAGRTPNPDVICNREIKFKAFLDYARSLGAEQIATGHYARIDLQDGRCRLLTARDRVKDQTYFLYMLDQQQLGASRFPLGAMLKSEVRALARRAAVPTATKRDSTGICFIGERRFKDFLQRYLPAQPGEIRSAEGTLLGQHDGLMYYTLGQRQGLRIGGRAGGSGAPWYVAAKDLTNNVLMVVQGHDHPLLYSPALTAEALHWVAGEVPPLPMACQAKIRYRQPAQSCTVEAVAAGRVRVSFDQPQCAVTPGQSVVLYAGEECLGGGVIAAAG